MTQPAYGGDLAWSQEGSAVYDYPLTGTIYDSDRQVINPLSDEVLPKVTDLEVWLDHRSPFEVMFYGALVGTIVVLAFLAVFS